MSRSAVSRLFTPVVVIIGLTVLGLTMGPGAHAQQDNVVVVVDQTRYDGPAPEVDGARARVEIPGVPARAADRGEPPVLNRHLVHDGVARQLTFVLILDSDSHLLSVLLNLIASKAL